MFNLTLFSHIRKCGRSVATRRCDDRTGKCTLLKLHLVSRNTSSSEEHFLWFLHKLTAEASTVCPLRACRAETESLAVSPCSLLLSELSRINIDQANDVPAAELSAGCHTQLRSTVSIWPVTLPASSLLLGLGRFTSSPLAEQLTGTLNLVQGCLHIHAGTLWLQGVHPPRGGFELQFGKKDFLLLTCNTMPPPKYGKLVLLSCNFGLTQMGKASYITYLEGGKPNLLCSSCSWGKKD